MTILTITPNPAFDRIQTIPNFQPGEVLRADSVAFFAGGKGVNAARAIHSLGGKARCTGFLAGHTGRMLAEYVGLEGIQSKWTWIDGDTRVSVIVVDPEARSTTVLNEAGPTPTPDDWSRLQADVLNLAEDTEAVCICGSLPSGLHPDVVGDLLRALQRQRHPAWVDTSGPTLKVAVQARPAVIKVNNIEAANLLGWRYISDVPTAIQAAQTIQNTGISQVILTLGKSGAVMVSDAGAWYAKPPSIDVVSPIGSGDAFLAGLVQGSLDHMPAADMLRQAVAAGTANALSVGGGAFTASEFEQILNQTNVKQIH